MKVEDFCLQRDDDGIEYLIFAEGPIKTRQRGLKVKPRLVTPKMFATGNEERCPVMMFKVYLEKRPEEIKTTGPFYLSVIDKPVSNVWSKKTPMGKNTIDSISNGNRTEWSPIRSVIIRVITKSDDRAAGVRFVYHEYDYRPILDDTKSYYQLIIKITISEK